MICKKPVKDFKVRTHCQLFHPIEDREFWDNIDPDAVSYFESNVKLYEGKARPHLTASLYREFAINGNRSNFQDVYFGRRAELINKVLVECAYNDGRYLNDILDLTWMILEETTWTLPAHNREVDGIDSLPDFKNHSLDLFLAETACTMAFVYCTMGKKLDELSRVVSRRIKWRLGHDLIDDYLARSDYWWMGFSEKIPNNWNPWVNSNVLAVAMIVEDDAQKLKRIVDKVIETLDIYLKYYPEDGGCDEGPAYWNQAGLSMLECMWLLNIVSDGEINRFSEKKVVNTSEYLMKVYIGGGRCVNFADSRCNILLYPSTMFKFGEIMGNQKLADFSKYISEDANWHSHDDEMISKSIRMYDVAEYTSKLKEHKNSEFKLECDCWIPSIEVMTSRTESDFKKGLFIAAKGGHNGESHNHNDVGNFIVYKNGIPYLIDSGNMTYTKTTFSSERYTLWTTQSAYHNLPTVGGYEQAPGREYAAEEVSYHADDGGVVFSLDLKDTFYENDIIKKWVRTIRFDRRKQEIRVTEDFEFTKESEFTLNYLTPQTVLTSESKITLLYDGGGELSLEFNQSFDIATEKIEFDDKLLKANWGDNLYRIKATQRAKAAIVEYIIK